jgi:hypothetical protein
VSRPPRAVSKPAFVADKGHDCGAVNARRVFVIPVHQVAGARRVRFGEGVELAVRHFHVAGVGFVDENRRFVADFFEAELF